MKKTIFLSNVFALAFFGVTLGALFLVLPTMVSAEDLIDPDTGMLVENEANPGISDTCGTVGVWCSFSQLLGKLSPGCRTAGTCSGEESVLATLNNKCNDSVVGAFTGCTDAEKATLASILKQNEERGVTCAGTLSIINNPFTCFFRWGFSWLGAALIWIGIKLATVAAGIFETAIRYLIVDFGDHFSKLKPGIDAGWTALRDIANIVIIGMFVFIAINIILGVKEFGDKKRVAQVLIIAVLINFSLLFTKIIVDASNFTAYQFYHSMSGSIDSSNNTSSTVIQGETFGATLESRGIASQFMQFLGVQSIADSQDKLREVAETQQSALLALGYGFISFVLLIAVAMVFLYGAFLIVSRAVLIILLMLTSALAFASWLIPQQYIGKGFSTWWESLLKSAFFAPILIALLWATAQVAQGFNTAFEGQGSLGKLAFDGSSEANSLAVVAYLVVIGLLFASIYAASTFSKTISGFKMAKSAVGGPLGLSLAGGSRLTGLLGRNSLGWAGAGALAFGRRFYNRPNTKDRYDSDGNLAEKGKNYDSRRTGVRGLLGRGALNASLKLSKATFDPLRSKSVSALASGLGGKPAQKLEEISRKLGEGGHAGVMARKAEAADKKAAAIGPTDDQKQQMHDIAQQVVDTQKHALAEFRKEERPRIESAKIQQAGRAEAEARKREHDEGISRTENSEKAIRGRHQAEMRLKQEEISAAQQQAVRRGETSEIIEQLTRPLRDLEARHVQELNDLSEQKQQHLEGRSEATKSLKQLDETAEQSVKEAMRPQVQEFNKAIGEAEEGVKNAVKTQELALRKALLWDKRAHPNLGEAMKKAQRLKSWKEWKAANKDLDDEKTPPKSA